MRQRIDRRRREQFEKFTRALGEVSPTHFMQDALKAGASSLDLQLFGAIPPITEARRLDTAGKAAIVQSERQAARTLIQKSKQESLNSKQAVVNEARQIRSAQWRLQSLRPPSMDSTRDGSFARSPWSESDWASSNGPTPRDIGRSSSAGTQITRTHSPMPGVPLGKAFEDMLANYYRTLEEIQDQEFAEAQKARQEESEQLQREHVRREHFEQQHRMREFAIVHELHRRERRRVFDASRTVLVVDRLAEEQRRRRFELHLRQEAAKDQREKSRQRRARYESHFDFILSQEALDRACGKVDMQKHFETQRADTKEKVEKRKEKWARKSRPLRARRLFQQEQKKICSLERERQHAYYAARQRAQGEREFQQKKENVRMAHLLKAIMRGWRENRNKSKAKSAEVSETSADLAASAAEVNSIAWPAAKSVVQRAKKEVLRLAMARKQELVVSETGAELENLTSLVAELQKNGYKVSLLGIFADPRSIMERGIAREIIDGKLYNRSLKKLKATFQNFGKAIALVDGSFKIVHNASGEEPKVVLEGCGFRGEALPQSLEEDLNALFSEF